MQIPRGASAVSLFKRQTQCLASAFQSVSNLRRFADDTAPSASSKDAPSEEGTNAERAESERDASTSEPQERVRKRKPTRAQRGSWVNNPTLIEEVVESAPVWPVNRPFYDVQGQAPFLLDATNPVFEAYQELKQEQPELFQALYETRREEEPPRPGASKILHWEINVVFDSDPLTNESHPLNKKAKCRVYLRDLQQEFGLSDAALQYIALICGPRYNPKKGLLTLTSERYSQREDNRQDIVEILQRLVEEGESKYPNSEKAAIRQ